MVVSRPAPLLLVNGAPPHSKNCNIKHLVVDQMEVPACAEQAASSRFLRAPALLGCRSTGVDRASRLEAQTQSEQVFKECSGRSEVGDLSQDRKSVV